MPSIGSHCMIEMYGCPSSMLDDVAKVRAALREAIRRSGCTLLREVTHRFEPQGVTAVGLLAESHISIHTWPELGYAAADIFTCGTDARPEQACRYLAQALRAERFELATFERGPGAPAERPTRIPAAKSAGEVA